MSEPATQGTCPDGELNCHLLARGWRLNQEATPPVYVFDFIQFPQ